MTGYGVRVRHNFETAHRLPHIGGKCASLHGHSWWVEVTVTANRLSADGMVVEFGAYKKSLREWIDHHLDHGMMIGAADPLRSVLVEHGTKLFVFGVAADGPPFAKDLEWPTVEGVAVLLGRVAEHLLITAAAPAGTRVSHVAVRETHVNTAEWTA
jgi:6-pyruvoyltetrahydropterin/6-carboxytetrahydropterin synthase